MRRTNLRTTRTAFLGIGLLAIATPTLHARSFPIPIAMPWVAEDYEVVDVTGDGHVDLVVATEVGRKLAVLPGDGTGHFGDPIVTEAPGDTEDLVVADFDGDGTLDAALIGSPPGGLVIALGNGDGSFRVEHTPDGIGNVIAGATADSDGDAVLDLILVERFADALVPLRGVQNWPHQIVAGDFDHDGRDDVFVSLDRSLNESEPGYWILRGTTNGLRFERGEYADFIAQGATVVDYDADGHLDIIKVAIGYFPTILRGDGSFGFEPTPYLGANGAFTDVVIGNFDTDAALDIVLSGADSGMLALILAPDPSPQTGAESR